MGVSFRFETLEQHLQREEMYGYWSMAVVAAAVVSDSSNYHRKSCWFAVFALAACHYC